MDFSVAASLDDSQTHALGYKDELELRFIWDRLIGKGRGGTVVRAVVDRFTGQEYACKCMPKEPPADDGGSDVDGARRRQLAAIKREITLFTRLRSSLNVARLEQVYEDASHVYLVMERCEGPTLADEAAERPHSENEVARSMRSVVRTIAQVHDHGTAHGAVAAESFMLLGRERSAPLKCIGFGPEASVAPLAGRPGSIFERISTMAPEVLSRAPSLGKRGDMWAAGIMAARLLTGYFPFDDIVENAIDQAGVLEHVGPVVDYLNDNPLMPSGAALFVSAVVMLLDFSRPHWQPVSNQAKDFVVQCLNWQPERRITANQALAHPWFKRFCARDSPSSKVKELHSGVVQRIQRFGAFNHIKRAALEKIADQLVAQHSRVSSVIRSLDDQDAPASAGRSAPHSPPRVLSASDIADRASEGSLTRCSPFTAAGPKAPASEPVNHASGASTPATDVLPGMEVYHGLLEHLIVNDGVVNRVALQEGLSKLG